MRFERPTEQALALATEPQVKREERSVFFHTFNTPVVTFEQSENVTIAYLVRAAACSQGCGLCGSKFIPLPSVHAHCTNGQFCTGKDIDTICA